MGGRAWPGAAPRQRCCGVAATAAAAHPQLQHRVFVLLSADGPPVVHKYMCIYPNTLIYEAYTYIYTHIYISYTPNQ